VVSVKAMCSKLVLGFNISVCLVKWDQDLFLFFNFFLLRIMCVGYLIAIWGKDSISLWILELEFVGGF
jgi:NADH:ubiquinone oxidoreductase subunit 4 (subunit M)